MRLWYSYLDGRRKFSYRRFWIGDGTQVVSCRMALRDRGLEVWPPEHGAAHVLLVTRELVEQALIRSPMKNPAGSGAACDLCLRCCSRFCSHRRWGLWGSHSLCTRRHRRAVNRAFPRSCNVAAKPVAVPPPGNRARLKAVQFTFPRCSTRFPSLPPGASAISWAGASRPQFKSARLSSIGRTYG